jgi:hypothetical protein
MGEEKMSQEPEVGSRNSDSRSRHARFRRATGRLRPGASRFLAPRFRLLTSCSCLLLAAGASAVDDYASAARKFDSIENDRLKPGARVELTMPELQAYAQHEMPAGVRNPRIQVTAPEIATGAALVDFEKLERSLGRQPGWLMRTFLGGERPVTVTARIRSAAGKATVEVQKVQISGMEIEGATLNFLIGNVLLPMYPDAAVNRPFELGHRIDRIDVKPKAVAVVIGR